MINDFIFLLSTMLVTFVAHYYYTYFTRVNPLPGPFPFPFIGNLPQIYWWFNGNGSMFYDYCYEKYGDVHEIYNGMERTIVLCRSECLEDFMSKNTHEMRFHNSKGLEELGIAGKGITFNNNFKSWIFNRHVFNQAILSPEFTNEAIVWTNKLFNELENYWNKLFLKGEIIKENKNRLNLPEWFNHYTNDMIIRMLTGEKSYSMVAYFDTLSNEKSLYPPTIVEDSVRLFQSLRKVLMGYSIFFLIPPFLRNFVPFLKNIADDVLQSMGFINQRLDAIIKKRRRGIENTPLDKPLPHDMLTTLIIKNTFRDVNYIGNDEASRFMTDSEIRVNLFDGIFNGTCKTSNMLSLIVYYIVHNPDVKRKMLEEIDSIFQGNKKRQITKDDYYSLSYCEAIVKEVARVFPIMHSFTRYIDKPNEIAGYQWPADTLFIINVKAIHNNDDYWEEPNKFNPDRWMVENFEPKKNSFIMFGGGLRLCPGRKLVMIELVCLMALLFRKYEINLVDMSTPIKTKTSYDSIKISELLVEIKPRN
ncbi:cytochrome P450 [Rhizophagus irregularis]|uniref:Cytochrome P450 n=1 Tax=Rhizophagus irregularis TaxID=588596 RepID=A0A2I1GVZ8_9GLOM|nr:cytochrome P450 [Rhizophagus irregularis]